MWSVVIVIGYECGLFVNVIGYECGLLWLWSIMNGSVWDCGLYWTRLLWTWSVVNVVCGDCGLWWLWFVV